MNGPPAGRLSLGARSQLLAARFEGEVVEHGDWLVVRTASNPSWYWGNFLLTIAAPRDDDLALWLARAAREIGAAQPKSDHVALWVDAPVALEALPAWRAAGFEFNATTALQLEPRQLVAAPVPRIEALQIRSLRLPEEAAAVVDLQARCNDDGYEPAGYRRFRALAMDRVARMHAQGRAHWFGVFAGEQLVADCGLVVGTDAGLARFQDVETHPDWRRRGACRALVHHVARFGFDSLGVARLVMCADPAEVAIGIYRSVGFRDAGGHWQLQRRAAGDALKAEAAGGAP